MKIQCAGVLFDLDGVLVDSTLAVARAWTKWARRHGFEPEAVVHRAHGRPSISTIRELLPNGDLDAENAEMERNELQDTEGVVALPGALDLLRTIPAERWVIATSCTRPLALVRIRVAGLPEPKHLITSSEVIHGKPDPEPYLKAAESLRADPMRCVVVEDAPAGSCSGKSAGARVLALRTTTPEIELTTSGADWVCTDLTSLRFEAATCNHLTLTLLDQGARAGS